MADTLTAPARGLGSLGRHELHRVLQRGRHAVTYEARDVRGAAATVTTLPVDLPGPPWLRMFEAGRFVCFPAVLEQGEAAGLRYVVTAPVQGESCEQLLARQGPLAPSIAARIVLELCRDFETAGSELPLHRALSAESVWLWRDEHGHWHCQLLLTTLWERWLEDVAHEARKSAV